MLLIRPWLNGAADYLLGLAMLVTACATGFPHAGLPPGILLVAGAALLLYSVLTDYSVGRYPLVPVRVHRILDMVLGAAVALSPWLLGFGDVVWEPHAILGGALATVGFFTARRKSLEPEPPPAGAPATA
jgi:hypothetical protein